MALSGVEVIAKRSVRERQDGRCEYRFELNLVVDPAWQFFFVPDPCAAEVEFGIRDLALVCRPEALRQSYAELKSRITRANESYAREREVLIAYVIAKEEGLRAAREEEARRTAGLQREFDRLEL